MNKKLKHDLKILHDLHRNGERSLAREGYLAILKKFPHEVEALHGLGIIYAQQNEFSKAIEYFEAAVKQKPNEPTIYLHLANALKMQNLLGQAILILEKALQHYPDYAPALNNLGTIYYAQGKLVEAIHFYQLALTKKPDYVDAYYNLGLAFTKQNAYSDAIQAYEKLLTYAPKHIAARFHLACALMQLEKLPQAQQHFLEIEKVQPHHFETQTNLATNYLRQGNFNAAKTHYVKALALSPDDTQILFNLGFINMQQGHVDQAIQNYQKVVGLNPDDFAGHNNLGVAFLGKQHLSLALQHFREALRIQPNNQSIAYTVKMLAQHEHLLAAPPAYIEALFDSYADHYEPHLLTALEYQVPQLLQKALLSIQKPKHWDILDIGCGTGLCGIIFKPYAQRLVGIDLSKKMLAVATQKNIYDELIAEDFSVSLKQYDSAFDLIVAGDVFVYLGDLAEVFHAAYKALKKEGLLIFNAEIDEKVAFKMNQSGRFSHQKKYLDQLAHDQHFQIAYYDRAVTRMQNNEPVKGHIYILQKIANPL